MDPVSSLNLNTSQFYVAFSKDANIAYAATEQDSKKSVSQTDEKSKTSDSETEKKDSSKTGKKASTSYIIDIMDEDSDGVVTTKEIISYYKGLATTKQEELDKQIKNSKATIEEIKKETDKSGQSTGDASKTTENDSKKEIVTPEEQAKKIAKEIGFKDGQAPDTKEIREKTAQNDIIEENRKAILANQHNRNLPSFMASATSTQKDDASNVVSIDKNQQEAEKSPLELESVPKTDGKQAEDAASPLELTKDKNVEETPSPLELAANNTGTEESTYSIPSDTKEDNPLSTGEEETSKDNVYDINDYKLKKALNSYQTVESNVTPFDYSSKISVNI